jgi:hypothetical protein
MKTKLKIKNLRNKNRVAASYRPKNEESENEFEEE